MADEQDQKRLSESEARFEEATSKAASLLTHFAEDQAEIRLVIDDRREDFGIGKQVLHGFLKELAIADPNFVGSFDEEVRDGNFAEILNDESNSHIFFLTAEQRESIPVEIFNRAAVVHY